MPFFKTSQEWLEKSTLLLEAHPTTTKITTRYSIRAPPPPTEGAPAKPPRGDLTLTTYDPVSGVALKYRTTKAAEVSRLMVAGLGRLGRGMAGVPQPQEAEGAMEGVVEAEQPEKKVAAEKPAAGSGGGKKKKRGKK